MKVKTWIPLALAVVLGLAAMKLTRDAMSRGKAPQEDPNVVATVIAARDIEPGQTLTSADLTVGKAAKDSLPAGAFAAPADAFDRVALSRLVKGQPVLESALAPAGTGGGVQALIPAGMRAITLQVNEFSGLAGMLVPGCRVDIISVIRSDQNDGSVARTIVQNVEVRAVGQQVSAAVAEPADAPGAVASNVTLLVTPGQAEAVQLASIGGSPWLVLRNTKDAEPVETSGVSIADLRGKKKSDRVEATRLAVAPKPPPVEPVAAPKALPTTMRTVRIIRATKEEKVDVEVAAPAGPAASPAASPAPAPPTGWVTNADPADAVTK